MTHQVPAFRSNVPPMFEGSVPQRHLLLNKLYNPVITGSDFSMEWKAGPRPLSPIDEIPIKNLPSEPVDHTNAGSDPGPSNPPRVLRTGDSTWRSLPRSIHNEGRPTMREHHFRPAPPERPSSRSRSIKDGYLPGNPYHQSHHSLTEDLPLFTAVGSTVIISESSRKTGLGEELAVFWHLLLTKIFNASHLFLPLLYYSRVIAIFEEVQCSGERLKVVVKDNIRRHKQITEETRDGPKHAQRTLYSIYPTQSRYYDDSDIECPPEVEHLKYLWSMFIDTITKEWEIMNIISVMLLSVIISSLQLQCLFANEAVRYLSFGSMVCGLMSLIFSCTYIIRFSVMRPIHKAVEWAKEGEAAKAAPCWNVWIFLSIPAVWLSWSLILFVAEIVAFIWLVEGPESAMVLPSHVKLGAKIFISVILGLGVTFLGLILGTLRRYGTQMDKAWKESIDKCNTPAPTGRLKKAGISLTQPQIPSRIPGSMQRTLAPQRGPPNTSGKGVSQGLGQQTHTTSGINPQPAMASKTYPLAIFTHSIGSEERPRATPALIRPIVATKLSLNGVGDYWLHKPPEEISCRLGDEHKWPNLIGDISEAWKRSSFNERWQALLTVLRRWNKEYLRPLQLEAVIRHEMDPSDANAQHYSIYLRDTASGFDPIGGADETETLAERCGVIDDTGTLRISTDALRRSKYPRRKRIFRRFMK